MQNHEYPAGASKMDNKTLRRLVIIGERLHRLCQEMSQVSSLQ